jgi:hypothetical protein
VSEGIPTVRLNIFDVGRDGTPENYQYNTPVALNPNAENELGIAYDPVMHRVYLVVNKVIAPTYVTLIGHPFQLTWHYFTRLSMGRAGEGTHGFYAGLSVPWIQPNEWGTFSGITFGQAHWNYLNRGNNHTSYAELIADAVL